MFLKWQLLILGLGLVIFLNAQNTISGVVLGEDQQVLENVAVVLLPTNQGVNTNALGEFEFSNLEEGNYTLQFALLGYAQARQELQLKNGSGVAPIQLQLKPSSFVMDEVLIKGTRAGEKTPMTYTNLEEEVLEQQNLGQDVPFLLRWTPSAIVTSDAGAGIGYTGIRIRGTDPTRINITINGVPLNDS